MTTTTAKIILAIGLTALTTAAILIAVFAGFLFYRTTASGDPAAAPPGGVSRPDGRRERGPISVAADEIVSISLVRSGMASTPAPAAFFGNINPQNFKSSRTELAFTSDGTAVKTVSSEQTSNGVKTSSGPTKYVVTIGRDAFAALAKVLVDNDFANEPESRSIATLPRTVTLTVLYRGGRKSTMASNIGRDTSEMAAIIAAIDELDRKTNWAAAPR